MISDDETITVRNRSREGLSILLFGVDLVYVVNAYRLSTPRIPYEKPKDDHRETCRPRVRTFLTVDETQFSTNAYIIIILRVRVSLIPADTGSVPGVSYASARSRYGSDS